MAAPYIIRWHNKVCNLRIPLDVFEQDDNWRITLGYSSAILVEHRRVEPGWLIGTKHQVGTQPAYIRVGATEWAGPFSGEHLDVLLATIRMHAQGELRAFLTWSDRHVEQVQFITGVVLRTTWS